MVQKLIAVDNFIKNKIHTIRGFQVILDRDLAKLYSIETRILKQAVKRNLRRFPDDFMFILTEDEIESMVSQNVIPSKKYLGGAAPYVFTEQGVANISSIINSDRAIEMNILIMRAFVSMRKFLLANAEIFQRFGKVEQKLLEHNNKIDQVFKLIEDKELKPEKGIFFDGQMFDAYRFVADLVRSAKKEIILIDNYVDDSVLTLFSKRESGVKVIIYTKNVTKQLKLDLEKYNSQYEPVFIEEFSSAHDRFMIIDSETVYHIGASLKDLGKKWFAFSRFEKGALELLNKLK